jgi:hypothetical protein
MNIIRQMESAGGELTYVGEGLVVMAVTLGDEAHLVYKNYCLPNGHEDGANVDDPLVAFNPPIAAMGVIPQFPSIFLIAGEANAIATAYAPLLAPSFAPGAILPAVGPPVGVPVGGIMYHHSSIAAHAFVERISTATAATSPTIAAQPSGTILGSVNFTYANAVIGIIIPKA